MNKQQILAEYTNTFDIIRVHQRLGYKNINATFRFLERNGMLK